MLGWNGKCSKFSNKQYQAQKRHLRSIQLMCEKYPEGGDLVKYIEGLETCGNCDRLAIDIMTEQFNRLEGHVPDKKSFYNHVYPYLARFPVGLQAALPQEYSWSRQFALVELAGEMALRGSRFNTFSNIDFTTGSVRYLNRSLTQQEKRKFEHLGLLEQVNEAIELQPCTHQKDDKTDCEECFLANTSRAGGAVSKHDIFETERMYRRDLRNAVALRDLGTALFLLEIN